MFQYISCYSLSYLHSRQNAFFVSFQYISCYSLSQQTTIRTMQASVSIHLMLLFISRQYQEAQYLLDVSIHLMLLFIQFLASYDELEISFNTSHVTLYLERASDFVDTMTLFQYISCYSLSKEGIDNMKDVRSFNTSHVTLYRLSYRNSYQLHLGFNTSHVTLYHSCFAGAGANCSKFQYISLYHPC